MKIITWNVNGIRAREAQVLELLEREQPDILCLQELKAKRDQIPETLCDLGGYWCYWHGAAAYSGVSLHVPKERFGDEPQFVHPLFQATRVLWPFQNGSRRTRLRILPDPVRGISSMNDTERGIL